MRWSLVALHALYAGCARRHCMCVQYVLLASCLDNDPTLPVELLDAR